MYFMYRFTHCASYIIRIKISKIFYIMIRRVSNCSKSFAVQGTIGIRSSYGAAAHGTVGMLPR